NPEKLRVYGLSASDVLQAVRGQNVQFASGSSGSEPSSDGTAFTATVTAECRCSTSEEVAVHIRRVVASGTERLRGYVACVVKGASAYGFDMRWNGQPASGFAVQLAPGANALGVAEAVRERMDKLAQTFPEGVEWFSPFDSSDFVEISIVEVLKTLA